MGKTNKKYQRQIERMLHDNDEIALQRIGIKQGETRIIALGIHKVHSTKVKPPKWGTTASVKVERVHKFHADTSSVAWKRYIAKEITFEQFKASGRML